MKKNTLLLIGAAAAAYFLFVKKGSAEIGSAAYSGVVDDLKAAGNKQSTTNSGTQSSLNAEFMQAVDAFGNAPVNTTKSISVGIDVINTAVAANIQLPRTSQTLVSPTKTSTGTTGGIAKLAGGSVVSITTTNKTGVTELDKIIAKNFAAKGGDTPTGYKSNW